MAKVRAPLLSFSASGQIAETLVYFTWKGINAVRQYVIPTNPRSALQIVQRGYFSDAVDEWHETKYTAADIAAWNRYAGILADPMSGFNAFVKSWIDIQRTVVPVVNPPYGASIFSGGAGLISFSMDEDGEATTAFCDWGYSPTAMVNTAALVEAPANTWTLAGVAATVGATVYGRYWSYDAVGMAGISGIYTLLVV